MKRLFTILFVLISISVFSQVRTNVFRVAGDSTHISSSVVVPASLVIDAESNTLYVLPTGCAANTALYEIANKYAVSALIGQPDGTMIVAQDITLPVTLPEYVVINPDGTVNFAAGSGGVDTLWLKTGGLIYTRSDIDSTKIMTDFKVKGRTYLNDTLFHSPPDASLLPYSLSEVRFIVENPTDGAYYYLTADSALANVSQPDTNYWAVTDGTLVPNGDYDTAGVYYFKTAVILGYDSLLLHEKTIAKHDFYIEGNFHPYDTIFTDLPEYNSDDVDNVGRYVYQNTDGYLCFRPLDSLIADVIADIPPAGSDSSGWTKLGNYIYPTTSSDSVGVGNTSPDHEFDVTGNIGVSKNIYLPTTTSSVGIVKMNRTNFLHSYGTGNLALGLSALNLTLSGNYNIALGESALLGTTNGSNNTAVGYYSLSGNTSGSSNTALGTNTIAGSANTSSYNTAIGTSALYKHATGNGNTFVGHYAGYYNQFGSTTVAIGYEAAAYDTNAVRSVYIGYQAGSGNSSKHVKSDNVFIGYQAGLNEKGDDLLYISNSSTTTPLIKGNFEEKNLLVNNTLEFTSYPTSDNQANGTVATFETGESVAQWQICYMKSDGKLWKADADDTASMPALWMALEATNTTSGVFLERGYVRNDRWNWTVGGSNGIIFASPTAGGLTQTLPTSANQIQQPVAVAITSKIIYFNPCLYYKVVPSL